MAITRFEIEYLMAPEAPELPSLADILHRPAWQERAACRGVGVGDYFPGLGDSVEPAREVCGRCPVSASTSR